MTLFRWSRTAASNGLADLTAPFPEGMAPATYNDSMRGAMAAVAKYRDDIAGAIVTAGTSAAYTVSSYEGYDSLVNLSGQMIAFTPHATNAATVTLNMDSLGAKPLRTSPGVELTAGTIIQGTPYVATYNNADGAFYLQGFYGNPYNVPLAAGMDFWAPTAPNSSFVFPIGQAISRATYSALFGLIGTGYGVGDGSTTFNVPDKRGRVSAGMAFMGGSDSGRLTNGSLNAVRNTLGGAGGADTETLTLAQIPTGITSHNPGAIAISVTGNRATSDPGGSATGGGTVTGVNTTASPLVSNGTIGASAISVTSDNTGGGAHDNLQPTIICNYIMRII